MKNAQIFLVLAGVAAGLFLYRRDIANADVSEMVDSVKESANSAASAVVDTVKAAWEIPSNGLKYSGAINSAANMYNVPPLLLARVLYQESHFRDDIISGAKKSPAGAIGIAQFLPSTAADLKVNPYDPFSSIDGAARYLSQLFGRFGSWDKALAAYNWGQGNVAKKGLDAAPAETVQYVSQILADAGLI